MVTNKSNRILDKKYNDIYIEDIIEEKIDA